MDQPFANDSHNKLPVHREGPVKIEVTSAMVQEPEMYHFPKKRFSWNRVRRPTYGPSGLTIKNHFVAMMGEFVGTTMYILMSCGGSNVVSVTRISENASNLDGSTGMPQSVPTTSDLMYTALSSGFSLAVSIWIFIRVSGGFFNPAVSLGMALIGEITPLRAILLTSVQILGGICGCAILDAITPGTMHIRTTLTPGVSISRGLFIETFATTMLMLAVFFIAVEKHKGTFLAPIGIGLTFFVTLLFSLKWTGGSMNPVRSFSADVVLTTFDGYHWIYWVGPCLGSILAAGFYGFSKFLEFETVHAENEPSELTTISDTGADYLESGKIPRTDGGEGGGIVMVTTPDLASQNGHDAITKVPKTTSGADADYDIKLHMIQDLLSQLMAVRSQPGGGACVCSSMTCLSSQHPSNRSKDEVTLR